MRAERIASQPRSSAGAEFSRSTFARGLILILVIAGAWRIAIAAAMPCISRDGVTFCWFARDLAREGASYLRTEDAQQHPLFPLLILAAHGAATALGAGDGPLVWQRSAQVVTWLAGMGVVALCAAVGVRLVRRLELPIDARAAGLCAATLAAILPLNVWLSADVMSDQVHLAFYLAGVFCLLGIPNVRRAASAGALAALAFLTRPEGAVVLIAAIVAAFAARRAIGRRWVWAACVAPAAFLALTLPYFAVTGKLSPKKDPLELMRGEPAAALRAPPAQLAEELPTRLFLARLTTHDYGWHQIPFVVAYETFRAGRVVVPLLALLPLLNLRRRWFEGPLVGVAACFGLHALLAAGLLHRWGYLDPRHVLVLIALLTPFAAIFLARVRTLLAGPPAWRSPAVLGICLLPLALYALRIPNGNETYLRAAAEWLVAHDPAVRQRVLTGGNIEKRIAFYADMGWRYYLEVVSDWDKIRSETLRSRPDYLTLEFGRGDERAGHAELLAKLEADPEIGAALRQVHRAEIRPARGDEPADELRIFRLEWP